MKNAEQELSQPEPKRKEFYVYELREQDTGKVFYVGKGAGNRMRSHRYLANHKIQRHLYNKIQNLWRNGADYDEVKVFVSTVESKAFAEERRLIALYGRINLCNHSDGGEGTSGYNHSDEARKKMAEAHRPTRGDEHYLRKCPEKVKWGSAVHTAKLNEDMVFDIRVRWMRGEAIDDIVKGTPLTNRQCIFRIVSGKAWAHVAMPEGFEGARKKVLAQALKERRESEKREKAEQSKENAEKRRRFSREEVLYMRQKKTEGVPVVDIAREFGNHSVIYAICSGYRYQSYPFPENWKHETKKILEIEEVNQIRRMASEGQSRRDIAKKFKIKEKTIVGIVGGATYKHIPFPEGVARSPKRNTIPDNHVREIRIRRKGGESCRAIAKRYKVSVTQVHHIISGKCRSTVPDEPHPVGGV